MIKDFQKEHQAMAKEQKASFAEGRKGRLDGDKTRIKDFNDMMSGINKSISDICKEVSDLSDKTQTMMKGYTEEHKQMAADWADMESVLSKKGRGYTAPSVKKSEPAVEHVKKAEHVEEPVVEPVKKPVVAAPKHVVVPAVKKAEPVKVVAKAGKTVKSVKIRNRHIKG
jgi:hypothetical protein